MAKKQDAEGDEPKKLTTYTIKLDAAQMEKLGLLLKERGWQPVQVAYTSWAFKGSDCNASAYTSGKLVVAGKGTEDFVRFTLESEITQQVKLGYDEVLHPDWYEAHAGMDESGKGDFFGPVIAATVIADKEAIQTWVKAGVRDSKKIADSKIMELDKLIQGTPGVTVKTCFCGMPKYNELMLKPGANLNRLLAWQHATALAQALTVHWVPKGLLDQFTEQPLVQRELARKGFAHFNLAMRTKAEEDPVVAAASVVARAEFVRQMKHLSDRFGEKLQKGASAQVKKQAAQIIAKFGVRALGDFAKLHFRTAYEVVSEAGLLSELPLKEPGEKFEYKRKAPAPEPSEHEDSAE
jgi:ribonuclease HIII